LDEGEKKLKLLDTDPPTWICLFDAWKKFQKSSPKWLFHGDESHDTLCEEITFSQSQVLQNSW